MAQRHPSAIKRHRQSLKRRARNQSVRTHVRKVLRTLREVIENKEVDAAEKELRTVMRTLDKAVSKGVLPRNSASRRVARLSSQVAALKAS